MTRKLNLNPDQISPEEDEPIEVVLKRKVEEAKAKAAKNPAPSNNNGNHLERDYDILLKPKSQTDA